MPAATTTWTALWERARAGDCAACADLLSILAQVDEEAIISPEIEAPTAAEREEAVRLAERALRLRWQWHEVACDGDPWHQRWTARRSPGGVVFGLGSSLIQSLRGFGPRPPEVEAEEVAARLEARRAALAALDALPVDATPSACEAAFAALDAAGGADLPPWARSTLAPLV